MGVNLNPSLCFKAYGVFKNLDFLTDNTESRGPFKDGFKGEIMMLRTAFYFTERGVFPNCISKSEEFQSDLMFLHPLQKSHGFFQLF